MFSQVSGSSCVHDKPIIARDIIFVLTNILESAAFGGPRSIVLASHVARVQA